MDSLSFNGDLLYEFQDCYDLEKIPLLDSIESIIDTFISVHFENDINIVNWR